MPLGGLAEAGQGCVCGTVKVALDRRVTLGIRLLADLRTIFGEADALHTVTILDRLCNGEEWGLDSDAPWADLHGKPLAERGLASMLKKYDISSMKVKVPASALQGYRREHLWDAWQRYLAPSPKEAEPVEPAEPAAGKVPEVPEVPVHKGGEGPRSVLCRDGANFDPEATLCRKRERPVDPEHDRSCEDFDPPF